MIQAVTTNSNFQFAEAEILRSRLPQSLHRLADLAYNYWWSWQPEAVSLFESIDPTAWERCAHNPVMFLAGLRSVNSSDLRSAIHDDLETGCYSVRSVSFGR